MIKEPFFSIIIPTFNRPIDLKRAISSVLKQTYTNYEIIIIDNGTITVENTYLTDKIIVTKEKKIGGNFARNTGINLAKGLYVCFLDDDDEYLPNHLQVLHNLIVENNFKVGLYKSFAKIETKTHSFIEQNDPIKPLEMHKLHYISKYPTYMNCVCIHKDIFKKHLFNTQVKVAQDFDLWIRIVADFDFYISPIITNIYHFSPQSTSTPSKEKYYNYINLYNGYFKNPYYGKFIPKKIQRDRIFKYYFWLLCEFKKELTFNEYISALYNVIYYNPRIIFEKKIFAILLK